MSELFKKLLLVAAVLAVAVLAMFIWYKSQVNYAADTDAKFTAAAGAEVRKLTVFDF